MNWIDDEHIDGELSGEKLVAAIVNFTRPGFKPVDVEIYRERFEYRGIPYKIIVEAYITSNNAESIKTGERRTLLEYTEESKPIHRLFLNLPYPVGDSSWLWFDSDHYFVKMTLREKVEKMHEVARADIDGLDQLYAKYVEKVAQLRKSVDEIKAITEALRKTVVKAGERGEDEK